MKKSLLAIAVFAAATQVNAAEMYAQDGVTIDISGEVDVQYFKTMAETKDYSTEIKDAQWRVDEANFGFNLGFEMSEDFSMGGHFDIDANNEDDSVTRGDVYFYVDILDAHIISAGIQPTILDDAGIGEDYEFGFNAFIENLDSSGEQVIKYRYDAGNSFYAGAAYSAYKNESADTEDDFELDGNVGVRLGDLEATLFVAMGEHNSLNANAYIAELRYVLGDIGIAGTYSYATTETISGEDSDINAMGLTGVYRPEGRFEYAAGWAVIDNDSNENGTVNDIYINTSFYFTDAVSAYAELGLSDEDNTDVGYVIGIAGSF